MVYLQYHHIYSEGLDNLNYFLIKFLFQISLGISFGVGVIAGLLTLCLFYVGLFLLGNYKINIIVDALWSALVECN